MKKIACVGATLAMALAAGSTFAAGLPAAGTMGLNISVIPNSVTVGSTTVSSPVIAGKYFTSKDMAILGGFGFATGGPSGSTTTTMALEAGMRKYTSTNDFAPFIGAKFDYLSTTVPGTPTVNPVTGTTTPGASTTGSSMTLQAQAGAEYFLSKQFSFEGAVGFGFQSVSAGSSATYIGTASAGLSANFYF